MSAGARLVVLLDVDNTLFDNDALQEELGRRLAQDFGTAQRDRYWSIFEALRAELGYADYLGSLQRFRLQAPPDPRLLQLSAFLLDYPFASRLYPGALQALAHLQRFGPTVILSDGDAVYQPRKIQRSGLWQAVQGRVLIYVHKELMLDAVAECYPAAHYVMVDDKLRILTAVKQHWGARVTRVFARQGRYGLDPSLVAAYPTAEVSIQGIGELARYDSVGLLSGLPPVADA